MHLNAIRINMLQAFAIYARNITRVRLLHWDT